MQIACVTARDLPLEALVTTLEVTRFNSIVTTVWLSAPICASSPKSVVPSALFRCTVLRMQFFASVNLRANSTDAVPLQTMIRANSEIRSRIETAK